MSSGVDPSREFTHEPVNRDRQKASQRFERARIGAAIEKDAEESRQSQPAAIGCFDEPRGRADLVVTHDLREEELGAEKTRRRGSRPAGRDRRADWPIHRDECPDRAAAAGSAAARHARHDRGAPTVRSPPSTTSAGNPFCRARSAYDRQYSSECFAVRNGTMRDRGTSCPRLVTRWRRLSSSSAPTALSVRNTNVSCRGQPTDGVIGVDPRVHALAGCELGARRSQLCREHRGARTERGQEIDGSHRVEPSLYNARR